MDPNIRENPEEWREFHDKTREYLMFLLFFLMLHFTSYFLICVFKMRKNGLFSGSYEDAMALRVSLWLCTFSLGISIGSALLLPMSIISNEILLAYPQSYYVQWLNGSLIQGLWNLVFLFSNLALFVLLPFSHIFVESEGLPGSSKGILTRAYESVLVLFLLLLMLLGVTYIISTIFDDEYYSITSTFNVSNYYLPFLYSCVSFMGVLMLLICTPVGFAHLFTVMGQLLIKMKNPRGLESNQNYYKERIFVRVLSDFSTEKPISTVQSNPRKRRAYRNNAFEAFRENNNAVLVHLHQEETELVCSVYAGRDKGIKHSTSFKRNFLYPGTMICLLVLTILLVLMVTQNALQLCFGVKALPIYSRNISLGISSLSYLGPYGAALEIILILYLWGTSIFGLYSLPILKHLRPKINATSMTQVIGNCVVLLILSSALPVLARSIGITNFDLLGDFGRINWLGNFYIVLFHNIVFAVTAVVCIGTKLTSAVRNELFIKLRNMYHSMPFKISKNVLSNHSKM